METNGGKNVPEIWRTNEPEIYWLQFWDNYMRELNISCIAAFSTVL